MKNSNDFKTHGFIDIDTLILKFPDSEIGDVDLSDRLDLLQELTVKDIAGYVLAELIEQRLTGKIEIVIGVEAKGNVGSPGFGFPDEFTKKTFERMQKNKITVDI